jgi:hypothetical protein
MDQLSVDGGCRCGRVRFRVSAPPLLTTACHCTGCQRMTASAFCLSAVIPAEAFQVTAGEPVIGGLHGPDAHHYFCPHCMSWLFTRAEGMDWFVNVRSTLLDEPRWQTPFVETYTSEKLPWVETPAVHSFPRFPDFDDYGRLVEAYQAQAGA